MQIVAHQPQQTRTKVEGPPFQGFASMFQRKMVDFQYHLLQS